jgi:putative transposase
MNVAYWRLHYHLVWTTYLRAPMIDAQREPIIHRVFHDKAKELGVLLHAFGNVEDHAHLVVSIPPKIAVADCVRHFKGASSYAVNQTLRGADQFKWQDGYGALSLGEEALATVAAYARNQKQHHREGTIIAMYERWSEDEDARA